MSPKHATVLDDAAELARLSPTGITARLVATVRDLEAENTDLRHQLDSMRPMLERMGHVMGEVSRDEAAEGRSAGSQPADEQATERPAPPPFSGTLGDELRAAATVLRNKAATEVTDAAELGLPDGVKGIDGTWQTPT